MQLIIQALGIAIANRLAIRVGMRSGTMLSLKAIAIKSGDLAAVRYEPGVSDPRMTTNYIPKLLIRLDSIEYVEMLEGQTTENKLDLSGPDVIPKAPR